MNTTVSSVHIQYCRKKTLAMAHKHTSIMTCMHFIINIYTQSCIFNMTYGLSHKTFELNSPLFMYGQGLHVVVILCMVKFSCILINILLNYDLWRKTFDLHCPPFQAWYGQGLAAILWKGQTSPALLGGRVQLSYCTPT